MSVFAITVEARQCALRYKHGRLLDILPSGRHRRVRGTRLVRVDLRERLMAIPPQEVLTSDAVSVRVTAAVRWVVVDPVAFEERVDDAAARVYLATQVALREALASLEADELIGRGSGHPLDEITAAATVVAEAVGVEVVEVVVKDVILPIELRAAAAELATARRRGAAQLEAARAETAALRSLANGASLLDAHPALAQLRLVQSAPQGTQLVLRVGPGAVGPGDAPLDAPHTG